MKQGDLFGSSVGEPGTKGREGKAEPLAKAPAPVEPPAAKPTLDAVVERASHAVSVPATAVVATIPVEAPRPAWRAPPAKDAGPRVLSVSELTSRIKDLLEGPLARVVVRGEVSGFRGPNARGHLYFSIKDERSSVDVKIWARQAAGLKFRLEDGLAVVVEGSISVYEPSGRYSLIANRVEPEGLGALALAFEQLKKKLLAEGLFGDKRTQPRRPLPALPKKVGVVTSKTGAALRDFLKIVHRRHPRLSVVVCDARMQGEGSAAEVVRALRWLEKTDVELIVVTRGGGSVEDLWTFNEEPVVRAIFTCSKPVVAAIGHEIDTTLAELVADVRASTPSAAAELVAPVVDELHERLQVLRRRLTKAVERTVADARHELAGAKAALGDPRRVLSTERLRLSDFEDAMARALRGRTREGRERLVELSKRLQRARPQAQLVERKRALAALSGRLGASARARVRKERATLSRLAVALERVTPRTRLKTERERLKGLAARLDALSPLAVLGRGYALARREADGKVVRRAADVEVGDGLAVRLGEGDELAVRVTGKTRGQG
jgi:exodeoxyribonuclease VII large subunit